MEIFGLFINYFLEIMNVFKDKLGDCSIDSIILISFFLSIFIGNVLFMLGSNFLIDVFVKLRR